MTMEYCRNYFKTLVIAVKTAAGPADREKAVSALKSHENYCIDKFGLDVVNGFRGENGLDRY